MERFFAAELLKQKRSFNKILLWLAPTVTILLALLLMRGRFLLAGAYNWWYMLILPGSLTMIAAFTAVKERRKTGTDCLVLPFRKRSSGQRRFWSAHSFSLLCALVFLY